MQFAFEGKEFKEDDEKSYKTLHENMHADRKKWKKI